MDFAVHSRIDEAAQMLNNLYSYQTWTLVG